jgi:hypothetical protein
LRNNSTFLVLVTSFCLSAIAYQAAQPKKSHGHDVKSLVKEVIAARVVMSMMVSQDADEKKSNDADDGDTDGIDWDQHDAFWCVTHPDECDDVVIDTVDDEDYGC